MCAKREKRPLCLDLNYCLLVAGVLATEGAKGEGTIAGIHAKVVELTDGRLLALGRLATINGRMPMSISSDLGKTWTYKASPFPPIGWS